MCSVFRLLVVMWKMVKVLLVFVLVMMGMVLLMMGRVGVSELLVVCRCMLSRKVLFWGSCILLGCMVSEYSVCWLVDSVLVMLWVR